MSFDQEQRNRTLRRVIAVVLGIAWSILIGIAATVDTPRQAWIKEGDTTVTTAEGFPSYTFHYQVLASARGSIRVENPVDVIVNLSNFVGDERYPLDCYCCIGFTGAHDKRADGAISASLKRVPLINVGEGKFVTNSEQLTWLEGGDSWIVLIPDVPEFVAKDNDIKVGNPAISVGTISDTLSWKNNEFTQRLTWVLVAFSVITVGAVIETLLGIENRR